MNLTHNQAEYLLSGLRKLDAPYPPELLAARRECFKRRIHEYQPVAPWTADLLGCDDEGCDNSLSGSLNDAGFGSGGPL
jgi:hypothetical protein